MTALASSMAVRAKATWLRALSPSLLAGAGVVGVTGALVAVTWRTWGNLDVDTGYDFLAATRVAHGDLPYVDFAYYYGPLSPLLGGLAALSGGDGVGPEIGFGLVVALAIVAATYFLARKLLEPLGAFLATSITAAVAFIPDNYSYVIPHTADATLGTLGLLLLLLGIHRCASDRRAWWLLAIGICLGILSLTKLECLAAGAFAVVVWLAVGLRLRTRSWREAGIVVASALAVPAAVYGAFLVSVPAHRLFLENLYPQGILRGNPIVRSRVPLTVSSFVSLGEKLVLYAIGIAAIVGFALVLRRLGRRLATAVIVVGTVLAIGVVLVKPEAFRHALQFVYGWIPAGVALALLLAIRASLRRTGPATAREQLELAGCAVLVVLAASTYPGFFPHAPNEQTAAYYIPFAAIFLARLHLGWFARSRELYALGIAWLVVLAAGGFILTVHDARAETATIRGPGGTLKSDPVQAAAYDTALAWIGREASPGQHIFVAPFMAGLYTLSGHDTPLAELSIIPGALPTAADEQRAIETLRASDVHVVVLDDRPRPEYGQTSFGESYDRPLAAWIKTHFRRVAAIHEPAHTLRAGIVQASRTLTIWVRPG